MHDGVIKSAALFLLAFGLDLGICAVLLSSSIDLHMAVYAILGVNMCLFAIVIYGATGGRQADE